MATYPPNYTLFDALTDWGSTNAYQISEAHLSKGGWEGWAQEEMRMLFSAGREDNCYQNSKRNAADIVLTPYSSGAEAFAQPYVENECVVIELKCESYFNAWRFREGVQKDIKKVNGGVFKQRLLRGGCNVYCVALSMTEAGDDDMESLGMQLFQGTSAGAPFRVWWCVRQFEPEDFSGDDEDEDEDNEGDDEGEDEEDDEVEDEMYEDNGVEFDVNEVPSGAHGYDNAYHNGYDNGYHSGHNGGWGY
ncbi:hypothetical protein BDV26DRAFT_293622 [Aspergillus bertholletiae]|uniref:Uncharacterized protein n=1 Tax=Aspergillus bertholletiae TaxID=1226010 RepID=A0A5N7B4B0_9EURO|nr:hypothetical protein BDV26DRAFT_293622 [Aspergillus bertholletiae]